MSEIVVGQVVYTQEDRNFFEQRGLTLREVARQRALLTAEEPFRTHADRACTVPDGVMRIEGEQREKFVRKGREAIQSGRLTDFVPASGAATRMFAELLEALNQGDNYIAGIPTAEQSDRRAGAVLRTLASLNSMAFYPELRKAVLEKSQGKVDLDTTSPIELLSDGFGRLVIEALVDSKGLGLASKPKALIPFHRYSDDDVRTALAEHLHTAVGVGAGSDGVCRIHFTCSPEHMEGFQQEAAAVARKLESEVGVTFKITFSVQHPSTDTVCVDENGELGRDAEGKPLLRPGGHGALLFNLDNLAKQGSDVVSITNIDNVHPVSSRREFIDSKLLLLGLLKETQEIVHVAVRALKDGMAADGVKDLYSELSRQIGLTIPDEQWNKSSDEQKVQLLTSALDRPVRVVGVVKNTGAAGGGPFWVRGADGRVTRQLVEKHELDPKNPQQETLFTEGTHFNPVRIMCGLKDCDGNPYDLTQYVNQNAVLISEKSVAGSKVKILELPGLWNGGMAEWITLFVEVDETTFAPVKSVVDLAGQRHKS